MNIEKIIEDSEYFNEPILEYKNYGVLAKGEETTDVVCIPEEINPTEILYPIFENYFDNIYYVIEEESKVDNIRSILEEPNFIKRKDEEKTVYYNNGKMNGLANNTLLLKKEGDIFIHRWYKENNDIYLDIVNKDIVKKFNSIKECYNISVDEVGFYYRISEDGTITVFNSKDKPVETYNNLEELKGNYQILREPIFPENIQVENINLKIIDKSDKLLYSNNLKV